jgi:hypothetical protein
VSTYSLLSIEWASLSFGIAQQKDVGRDEEEGEGDDEDEGPRGDEEEEGQQQGPVQGNEGPEEGKCLLFHSLLNGCL